MRHNKTKTLSIQNDIAEVGRLSEFLDTISAEWAIPQKTLFDINLSLEELVSNIMYYGYEDNDDHSISLTFDFEDDCVLISIIDDGFAFNPLTAKRPDINAPLENRKVGGLGIHLVRNLMDSMKYERKSGKNILQLTKRITKG